MNGYSPPTTEICNNLFAHCDIALKATISDASRANALDALSKSVSALEAFVRGYESINDASPRVMPYGSQRLLNYYVNKMQIMSAAGAVVYFGRESSTNEFYTAEHGASYGKGAERLGLPNDLIEELTDGH